MSRVTPAQVSFNGGAVSRRLRARTDQGIYRIAVAEMIGFAPLVEGPAEAMPGFLHVARAPGPCRLFRFETTTTQGHALEFSAGKVRVYTNDALVAIGDEPVVIDSPYSFAEVEQLVVHQSYDVLYCFHPDHPTREFFRSGPTAFGFGLLAAENGPFEARNKDEAVTVSASAETGDVTLTASAPLFEAGDVGGLFRIEASDFSAIRAWEPYITVTAGQLLTASERVYEVVGSGRTGGLTPNHTEGLEWDGIGTGTDLNDKPASGVQLRYVHDRFGLLRITDWLSETQVEAEVLRHLPTIEPAWRWSFGAFSERRGWPQAGCVWNERLCLAKGPTLYGSVAGDFNDFATINEVGEVSPDMAFTVTLDDPNDVRHLVAADRLLAFTASGCFAIGAGSAASGVGPNNIKSERQNSAGAGRAMPVEIDSRTVYIDRSRRRLFQADFDFARGTEQPEDLTRYARHMGTARFVALAAQRHPFNHLWAVRGDGSLALAVYLPEEEALGFAERTLAPGMAGRSLCTITDPEGEHDQVWLAAEYGGHWHVLRMAPWRHDGESDPTGCVLDMAADYDGAPATSFALAELPGRQVAVVADGVLRRLITGFNGAFTLPAPASRVVAGLEFPAAIEGLSVEAGGDNGSAMGRKARFKRAWIKLEKARGLSFGVPGDLEAVEQLEGDSAPEAAFAAEDGLRFREAIGDWTREPRLRVERTAPFQATVLAWGGDLDMEKL